MMSHELQREARDAALAFAGRMAADVSHELRNRFSTINEKDGLLADLLELSRRGRSTDPERLLSLSADIKKHVDLAEGICSDLNRFAHLADDSVREENIDELAGLIARLTRRRGLLHGLEIGCHTRAHVSAHVNPFQLGFALYQCLDWVMEQKARGELVLSALRSPPGPGVEIAGASFEGLLAAMPAVLGTTLAEIPGSLRPGDSAESVVLMIEENGTHRSNEQ
jgi:hypothetical protein